MLKKAIPYLLLFVIFLLPVRSYAVIYTIKADVNLREGPGLDFPIIEKLNHNQTLKFQNQSNGWTGIQTINGQSGYIRNDMVSDIWIKVHKKERELMVMQGEVVKKKYKIALCPFNQLGDKIKEGDGGTPEGRLFICETIKNPGQAKYGARSLRISYPNIEDARRGLENRLIKYDSYLKIVKSIKSGTMPSQKTVLGSSIRIHGGGNSKDWTLGCMALSDSDVIELFDFVKNGSRVEIFKSRKQDAKFNKPGYLNEKILSGAKNQLIENALYTSAASGLIRLKYPMGDIMPDQAVCTDIIIRALRVAGIDLQALIHEDVVVNPLLYKQLITSPSFHIDHRRTKNLNFYFNRNLQILPMEMNDKTIQTFQPGDILVFDTGIQNGTIFDHIGIIDNKSGLNGFLKVINIWTTGYNTESMELLGSSYPKVVGHFRTSHIFDYN